MAIDPLTTEIAVKVLCGGFFEYFTILMLQKHELLPVHNMYTFVESPDESIPL